MSPSISTRIISLATAAMVTFTIMASLDALAKTEQTSAFLASSGGITQTACVMPAKAPRS
jgi:hypothetical protein